MALVVVAGIGIGIRYGHGIVRRFSDVGESISAERSSSRLSLAKNAIDIYQEHKWVGVGSNNYRDYVFEGTAGLKIVHNIYLLILAENGFPGFILFLLFLASVYLYGWKYTKARDPYIANIATAALMSNLNVCIVGMTAPDLRLPYPRMFFYLIIGILLSLGKVQREGKRAGKISNKKAVSYKPANSIPTDEWNHREPNIIIR